MRPLANRRDLGYLLAVAACVGTAALALPLRDLLDVANIDMLFLLVVFMVAIRLGRPLSELRQMFPELLKKISRNFDQWRRAHRKLLHDRVEESRRQLFPVGRLRGISD